MSRPVQPTPASSGELKKPHMQVIDNLHYKYLFFLTSLDSNNAVEMEEEEKRLFAYMIAYRNLLFDFRLPPSKQLEDFNTYTKRLMQLVTDNYMSIFQDDSLDLAGFLENSDPNDIIVKHFTYLSTALKAMMQSKMLFPYISCVLICSALLFLVRTTKRALFMYLSQKASNKNDTNANIILTADKQVVNIKKKLSEVIVYVADFLVSTQNIVHDKIAEDANAVLTLRGLGDKMKTERATFLDTIKKQEDMLKAVKDQCATEIDALKKELEAQIAKARNVQSQASNKNAMKELEAKTAVVKTNLFGTIQVARNFEKLLQRWDTMSNAEAILGAKLIALDAINAYHPDYILYKDALSVILSKVKIIEPAYQGIMQRHTSNVVVQVVNALLQLEKEKVFMQPDGLDMLFVGSPFYYNFVILYEELSGAVRAVVRVRDVYSTLKGGKKRVLTFNADRSLPKRMRLASQSGGFIDKQFENYKIKLDKKNKFVDFIGINHNDVVFKHKTLHHGPFFSVHDNTINHKDASSVEDDLLKGIGFDTLANMFGGTGQSSEGKNAPGIILYTYGYSGSGKSYTLFGEKTTNNSSLPTKGVLWEVVRRLQGAFDLKLISTTICYGYLDADENGYTFKTNKPIVSIKNSEDTSTWANIINEDFKSAMVAQNDDSFIKVTPNNAESSRGFYIVKVGIYEKNSNYQKVRGYIGVVDMAGNEDPYDIAITICPTMKFEKMDVLLRQPSQTYVYDVVYEQIKNALLDILQPTILKVMAAKIKGYITEQVNNRSVSKILGASLVPGKQDTLITIRDKLAHTFNIFVKGKQVNYDTTKNKYISVTPSKTSLGTYVFEYVNGKVSKPLMQVSQSGMVSFYLTTEFLTEICLYIQQSYDTDIVNEQISVNDIREALLRGEHDKAQSMKIKYAVTRLLETVQDKGNRTIATLNIDANRVPSAIGKDQFDEASRMIQTAIIKSLERFDEQQKYLVPFVMDNKTVEYHYSSIARIIKEGYYINKANAELMDYFKKKLNMQDISKIVNVRKSYDFDESFSFSKYNKFARDFVSVEAQKSNTSQKEFEYDTGLVEEIQKQFPGKNKDIIFACVRNDKDFGKILGAIDTLELIRDLKST